jgi:hypothetical protein
VSDINRVRRYYLLKRHAADAAEDHSLRDVWRAKQEAEPGTLLPAGFPAKSTLEENGYVAVEDVHGASLAELRRTAGLNAHQAQAVIKAAEALI